MFKFLKEKVKGAVDKISTKIDKEAETVETPKEEIKQKPVIEESPSSEKKEGFFEKIKEKISKKEEQEKENIIEKIKEVFEKKDKESLEEKEERQEKPVEILNTEEENKGFLGKVKEKIVAKKISEKQFDDLFWDLELALLENNIAVEVIEKIKTDLKTSIVNKPIKRNAIDDLILSSLKSSIQSVLHAPEKQILELIKLKSEKPYVIVFLGTNGAGKTTTIAKIASFLQKNDLKCVLAASDTWRSAAIQQLEEHAKSLNLQIIKHDYGSDPAAVAFDAIKMAKSKKLDVVLIDTAGRQHSNINLIDELKKIVRVSKPDLKLYVGEMIAGNDCIDQIKSFDEAIDVDGVILTKADIDDKGGTAISVTYVTKKPIFFLTKGQEYHQLEEFSPEQILSNLGF